MRPLPVRPTNGVSTMMKPHGSEQLDPRFVYNATRHAALQKEADGLPSLLLNSAAAANAVMLGAGRCRYRT